MADEPTTRQKALAGLCDAITLKLSDLPVLEADAVLDEARRFAYFKTFSGYPDLKVRETLGTGDLAVFIAVFLAGLKLDELETVVAAARRTTWAGNFALMSHTSFGRQFAAYMELVESKGDPAKVN